MSTQNYDTVKKQIIEAMKAKDNDTRDFARVVKAEFDRKGDGQPLPEVDAVKILKSLKTVAEENKNQFELDYINGYLPKEMTEAEIEAWIKENIDFSQFKAPIAAIGAVSKALGAGASGETVKAAIMKLTAK